jgi:hypothetical protein
MNTVLSAQFSRARATCPEQRLMLAVLQDAIDIYRKYAAVSCSRRGHLIREAEEWLFSDDTSWPLSLVNVCDAVGIDVGGLRARLRHPESDTG